MYKELSKKVRLDDEEGRERVNRGSDVQPVRLVNPPLYPTGEHGL